MTLHSKDMVDLLFMIIIGGAIFDISVFYDFPRDVKVTSHGFEFRNLQIL